MIRVDGRRLPWHAGMTVADLLEALEDPQPCAVVRINEQYITRPKFKKTTVPDNAQVYLIPMIAGG